MQSAPHLRIAAGRAASWPAPACMACLLVLALLGCDRAVAPAEPGATAMAPGGRPVATLGPDDAIRGAGEATEPAPQTTGSAPRATANAAAQPASVQAGGFDPASVAETSVTLPPFPLFEPPQGLVGSLPTAQRDREFDRAHVIAGDAILAVEGRLHTDRFRLQGGDRDYSAIEFQRNYRDAVTALGGREVSRVQFTPAVLQAFGGRAAVDAHYHGACASAGCENHTYLIRQGGSDYWVQVSTGRIPPSGQVAVLQAQPMASALRLVSADEMKQSIDASGKVALHLHFDSDKATLRPDADPPVEQIATLLRGDPALRLSIEGHTDASGDAAHNRALSRQRAETVRAALIVKGIDADRLQAQGFGADRPVAGNASEQDRARNRRVELVRLD